MGKMNRLIGIRNYKNRNSDPNISLKDFKLVTVTAYYDTSSHYQQNVQSCNGFFYQKGEQTYLVTCTHLIFDQWQSVNGVQADKVKIFISNNDYFSRYFDVMIAKVSEKFSKYAINNFEKSPVKEVSVKYIDPLSNNSVEKKAEYVDKIASSMHLGAINFKLNKGSSGSPVLSKNNKIVGMVTSADDFYQNMTLCIPFTTINELIKEYNQPLKYLGFETNLVNSSWLTSIPYNISKDLSNNSLGELVLNSDISKINPFDLITKVNGKLVGIKGSRTINLALENQSKDSLSVEGFKISQSFRDKYCAYPRDLIYSKKEDIFDTKFYYEEKKIKGNTLRLDSVEYLKENTY